MIASLRRILQRHWPLLLIGLVVGFVAGEFSARRQRPLFLATGRVIIAGGAGTGKRPGRRTAETELREQALYAFKSVPLLTEVAQDTGMLPRGRSFALNDAAEPADQRLAISRLRAGLEITGSADSEVVSLSFLSYDPDFSAAVVNQLIADSVRYSLEVRLAAFNRSAQWPAEEVNRLKQQVVAAENHLLDTQQKLNLPLYNSEWSRLDKPALDLSQDLTRARLARIAADAELALLRHEAAGSAPSGNGAAGTRRALQAAEQSLATLAPTEGERNPDLLALRARAEVLGQALRGEQQRALRAAEARSAAAHTAEDALRGALAKEDAHLAAVTQQSLQLKLLQRDFFETRLLYTDLNTQLRTAMLNAGLEPSQIVPLDPATPPQEPVSVRWWWVALEGAATGLLLATLLALYLANLRLSPLERVFQAERTTDLPALAALPLIAATAMSKHSAARSRPGIAAQNLELLGAPDSTFSSGIRGLRSSLRLSTLAAEPRFILFTSATPSEGKSTVSSNYAAALAEGGSPTLLIDADMHRPNLHHRLGGSGARGLSSLLSGAGVLAETVQSVAGAGGLHLLPAGPVPPHPGHLLEQERWVELLREAATHYTYIVIDSPPVLANHDSLLLGQHVDAVVYVVRPGKVAQAAARRGRDLLGKAGAPLAGVVVNALPVRAE